MDQFAEKAYQNQSFPKQEEQDDNEIQFQDKDIIIIDDDDF